MKLRLILGDQLNYQHSWFTKREDGVVYLLMEIKQETSYVKHHVQKIVGFFLAMREFSFWLKQGGHKVTYISISDPQNTQDLVGNVLKVAKRIGASSFEYLLPDEYRLDVQLNKFSKEIQEKNHPPLQTSQAADTEHFLTERLCIQSFFKGKKQYLMESFYRGIRKKYSILMNGEEPEGGKWNFDQENRKSLPANHYPPNALVFGKNVKSILEEIDAMDITYFGKLDSKAFAWPVKRSESLQLLEFFCTECLVHFGRYEDAMTVKSFSVYHSRLSFSLNTKMLTPKEVVERAILEYRERSHDISMAQIEGFVRQIIGWREYMRGVYWDKMPDFAHLNYFQNERNLPSWFWTGKTKMNCMRYSIGQSLEHAYAHHIQRLMVIGNFSLLAGINPSEVDEWYLGVYMDAIEWVEITNTRGMSQYADGGIVGSKPYAASANYIHKMSDYCQSCQYDAKKKTGKNACPFNSLYWHFYHRNASLLQKNPRIGMAYRLLEKMDKEPILDQAEKYLQEIENL